MLPILSKKSKVTIMSLLLLSLSACQEKVVQNEPAFSEEEFQSYEASYKTPMALYVRSVLDSYLAGKIEGVDAVELITKAGELSPGTPQGLDSFDRAYFENSLLIMYISPAIMGGYDIGLVSSEPRLQDKVFNAWVYDLSETEFDLRGFWQNMAFTPEEIKKTLETYEPILDKSDSVL